MGYIASMEWDAAQIRRLRQSLNMSQSQFARLVGMHQPTIAALESGKKVSSAVYSRMFTMLYALSSQYSGETLLHILRQFGLVEDPPCSDADEKVDKEGGS